MAVSAPPPTTPPHGGRTPVFGWVALGIGLGIAALGLVVALVVIAGRVGQQQAVETVATSREPIPTTLPPSAPMAVPTLPPSAPTTAAPAAESPSIAALFFHAGATGEEEIWRSDPDGSNARPITDSGGEVALRPRVAPNGSRVVYYRAVPGTNVNQPERLALWSMNPDGTDAREIIPRGAHGWSAQGHAEWSPASDRIVHISATPAAFGFNNFQIWTTDSEGGTPRKLTERRGPNGGLGGVADPSWSPDGTEILFVGCPTDKQFCFPPDNEVYRFDLATGTETRLTTDGEADFDPYYDPAQQRILWLRITELLFFVAPQRSGLMLLEADGTQRVLIDDGRINTNGMWSPDGSRVYFSRFDPSALKFAVHSIDPNGSDLRQVTATELNAFDVDFLRS